MKIEIQRVTPPETIISDFNQYILVDKSQVP